MAKDDKEREQLIPNVEIFKEIMVELIKNRSIDIQALQKERREFIQENAGEFQLNDMLLTLLDQRTEEPGIQKIEVERLEDGGTVVFAGVLDENGEPRVVRCSNVRIRLMR